MAIIDLINRIFPDQFQVSVDNRSLTLPRLDQFCPFGCSKMRVLKILASAIYVGFCSGYTASYIQLFLLQVAIQLAIQLATSLIMSPHLRQITCNKYFGYLNSQGPFLNHQLAMIFLENTPSNHLKPILSNSSKDHAQLCTITSSGLIPD